MHDRNSGWQDPSVTFIIKGINFNNIVLRCFTPNRMQTRMCRAIKSMHDKSIYKPFKKP